MVQRLLLLSLLACRVANADDAAVARRHFQAGSSLFDLGKFREAAVEYEEAYKAKNDPALLFNIGQAYRGANDPAKAITAYKSFLRHVPDAPRRPEVEGFILRLQKQLDNEALSRPEQPKPPPPEVAQPETHPLAGAQAKPPLYKRPWLWAAVGGAVVVAVAVGVGVAYGVPKDAPAPPGALTVSF
jgi:tetratricopeptide (TPR) repeat protein